MIQLPYNNVRRDAEPIVADQTGYDQIISPPSKFNCLSPSRDLVDTSEPMFEIYDAHMERIDLDVDLCQDIVPTRGRRYFFNDGHNDSHALPPSENSQALVPVETSEGIVCR